eukprot:g10693.t1 g10693   contig4:2350344-2354045(-)
MTSISPEVNDDTPPSADSGDVESNTEVAPPSAVDTKESDVSDGYNSFLDFVAKEDAAKAKDAEAVDGEDKHVMDVEEAVVESTSDEDNSTPKPFDFEAATQKPTLFTDERGNLKIINFVVRRPCTIFWLIIVLCVALSFLLNILVFRQAENGNPFTVPENEFDLNDIRSIQYDSLRLAKDEVQGARKAAGKDGQPTLKQSELGDIAYWVFEGESPSGLFGSAEAIDGMKDAYDIFMEDPGFKDYCQLDYRTPLPDNTTERECTPPLTPLLMYYASEWDDEKVAAVIEELKDPENVELFNSLALCVIQGAYCDLVPDISTEDQIWAAMLGKNISDITSTWDMKGELVSNFTQVTELASYLVQVDLFKGLVDFGYDKNFSSENQISQFSRGIVFWGAPLEDRKEGVSEDEEEDKNKSENEKRKEYIKKQYLDEMNDQSKTTTHRLINTYYFMTAIIGDVILSIVTQDSMLAIFSFVFVFIWIRVNTQSWFLAFVGLFEIFFSIPVAWFIFTVVFQIKYFATLNSLAIFIVAAIGADDIFIFMDAYKQSQYHAELLGDFETRMSWVYRRTGTAMAITSATTCAAFLCTLITPLTSIQSFGIFAAFVATFVQVPLHRLVMGVLFLAWISIAIWQASQIEATKENEQFLNEDNPLQKSITIINNEFPTANDDLGLKVYYAWGLEEVSRDGVNRLLEPDNFGTPNFVEGFDFNEQCQSDLLDFCDKLKTDPEYKDLIKRKNGLGEVYCFVEELAAYNVKGDLTDCDYVRTGGWRNETWQVAPSDLADIMPGFLSTKSCYDEDGVETTSGRYSNEIGWDGKKLRYASVSAESNVLDPFGLDAESVTRREYDQFVKIAEEANQIMTKSCTGQVIMTDLDEKFVFMNNQNIYVKSAIQSSILGVAIAFVVLLLSTHVLHLAFFASLSIVCVLVSVVGTMVMLGWYLGSIESILICIIAGFSVDYVVHLAHAYEIAKGDTYARITEAFGDLGISVFNGMITSVVASIPLFFCQLQFFAKFGTFLCLTIAFSWVFANFVFMSLLAQLKIPLKEKGCRL